MVTLMVRSPTRLVERAEVERAARPLPLEQPLPVRAPRTLGIVLTADNHLSPALPHLPTQRRTQRRQRLREAFSAAVECAIARGARLFIQAGDLFDSPTPANEDLAFVAGELARLRAAGILCAGIGGCHDMPHEPPDGGGKAPQHVYAALDAMHFFAASRTLRPRLLELDGLRLALAGLSYHPGPGAPRDPLAGVAVDDPEGVLGRVEVGLLVLHAAVDGIHEDDREGHPTVAAASLAELPALFRVVAAGHIHRFGRARLGGRDVLIPGATERMDFEGAADTAGFSWLEVGPNGLLFAEHVSLEEQPRADLTLPTSRLWPDLMPGLTPDIAPDIAAANTPERAGDSLVPGAPAPEPPAGPEDRAAPLDTAHEPAPIIRMFLGEVCTEETMVRLHLRGAVPRPRFHAADLRAVLHYGRSHSFSFELDTSGFALRELGERSAWTVSETGAVILEGARDDAAGGERGADDGPAETGTIV